MNMQNELKSRYSGAEDMTELTKGVEPPKDNGAYLESLDNKWATIGTHAVCGFTSKTATTAGFVISHLSGVWMNGGISYFVEQITI